MRSYDKEFKEEAVKLAKEVGAVKAAQTLGISKNTLYTWISKEKKSAEVGVSSGKSSISSAETIRLLKEVSELKKANEILKAALGFCTTRVGYGLPETKRCKEKRIIQIYDGIPRYLQHKTSFRRTGGKRTGLLQMAQESG